MERQPHDPAQAELEKKMTLGTPRIDSESVGNPLRYRRLEELEEGLDALPRGPWDRGRVELIVARTAGGRRERPERVRVEAEAGITGVDGGHRCGPHTGRRHRNLRGIYMRTVEGGEIAPGDPVEVIARAPASDAKPLS